ncbi:MAG: C45 family autoproteolytic acyltransferase/hydrolase [Ruminococcus sp.]|nr:C45 family autoproteolytic acyltransferase/hydrolase [Ruminococcus sp.]
MNRKKTIPILAAALALTCALSGCGRKGYEGFVIPEQGASTLRPVSDIYRDNSGDDLTPVKEKTNRTVRSSDGLCVIECRDSYFDVTLDREKGSPYAAGAAYAEAIQLAYEDYALFCEGYIFENIKAAFNDLNGDYSGIENRTEKFRASLERDYREELEGFADRISGDSTGIREDGILSKEEAVLVQLIPDVLRATACSAISADGSVTSTGERLTCRVLEWQLGSENQLCKVHTLLHMKNGDKSFVSLSYLGSLTILTAVNDDGVMLGELDVGTQNMVEYSCEDKVSYTYGIRYALENCTTAREAAQYLVSNAPRYPYCVNVLATDRNDAVVAELPVSAEDGTPLIRDSSTPLTDGLTWDSPDYICAVNSFAAKGNADGITSSTDNIIRWRRYNELFSGERELSPARMRQLLTCERTDNDLTRIRSNSLVHMAVADYSTCTLQAILTDTDGVDDEPVFIDLGSWRQD